MSGHIWLTDRPDCVPLPRDEKALWVYADKRRRPRAERTLPASTYLADPWAALRGVERLVIVGLTDIVTPANRVKTGPFLNEPWRGPVRDSVDRCLFVGEPWRAWWHWGCAGATWDDVPHSFALEGRWNQALDQRRADPCTFEEFCRVGAGVIVADPAVPRFDGIEVDVIPVSQATHQAYQDEKAQSFEQETTWRGLVKRLGAFAQQVEPRRHIPSLSQMFRKLGDGPLILVVTDLPVDTFLVERCRSLVTTVDGVAGHFREDSGWTH